MVKGLKKIAASSLALLVGASCLCALPFQTEKAFAGSSKAQLASDSTVFDATKNLELSWYTRATTGIAFETSGGVTTIAFSNSVDTADTLVYRSQAMVSEFDGPILISESTVEFTDIKQGKSFGMYTGVTRLDFNADDATSTRYKGSTYIYAEKGTDGKYYGGVTYFGDTEIQLVENVLLGTNSTIHFYAEQYADGREVISIASGATYSNTNVIYDSKEYNETATEDITHTIGLFAFGGRGNSTSATCYHKVKLTHFQVDNYFEYSPENTNIYETFENDYVNGEEWLLGGSCYIGEGALHFVNGANTTGIKTKHEYSNFEISFDVVDMRRSPIYNEIGVREWDACGEFWIVFGVNSEKPESSTSWSDAMDGPMGYKSFMVGFGGSNNVDGEAMGTCVSYGDHFGTRKGKMITKRESGKPEDIRLDVWNTIYENRTFQVKLTMMDGICSAYLKWIDEESWTLIYQENLPEVWNLAYEGGYVQLWSCYGSTTKRTTMSIDNLSIVNLDKNPNWATVDFTKSGYQNEGDYVWIDNRNPEDLISNNASQISVAEEMFFGMPLAVGYGFVAVAGVALLIGIVVCVIKRKGE